MSLASLAMLNETFSMIFKHFAIFFYFLFFCLLNYKAFGSNLFGVSMPGDPMGGEYNRLGFK